MPAEPTNVGAVGQQARMHDHRWRELCQLIMTEKDPQKLLGLVRELNQEFERREQDLRTSRNADGGKLKIPDGGLPEEST